MREAEVDSSPEKDTALRCGCHGHRPEDLGRGGLSMVGAAEGHLRALAAMDQEEIFADLTAGGPAVAGQPQDHRPGDTVTIRCIDANGHIPTGRVYEGIDENALSVVLVLSYRNFQMYFGGDSNFTGEPFLAPFAGDVDVYYSTPNF
jgi:hypothetical protein